MTEWIYETPDNGKTVTRRILGNHEQNLDGKHLHIGQDKWVPMGQIIEIARQTIKEQSLRHEYPALNELWDQYHVMLRLLSHGDTKWPAQL
jgi:hypothetical protein